LNTYKAPGLLVGGIEFTVAVTAPVVVVLELQAARKASRPSAPAPAYRAERFKKLLRLKEDPKSGSGPMKDLLEKKHVFSLSVLRRRKRSAR
jgi:hypothetical protein